jgi:RNA polymerase sigma factor, sigma-70 family
MPKHFKLNAKQQQLVEDNMLLVGAVISERVHAPDKLGLFTRGDLFQIGCEGLCKAAAYYKETGSGSFSTYAYRTIYHHICDAMRISTICSSREVVTNEIYGAEGQVAEKDMDISLLGDVYPLLESATKNASLPIRNGTRAIVMRVAGYSAVEISAALGASQEKIRVWISRARKFLVKNPQLAALAANMNM